MAAPDGVLSYPVRDSTGRTLWPTRRCTDTDTTINSASCTPPTQTKFKLYYGPQFGDFHFPTLCVGKSCTLLYTLRDVFANLSEGPGSFGTTMEHIRTDSWNQCTLWEPFQISNDAYFCG